MTNSLAFIFPKAKSLNKLIRQADSYFNIKQKKISFRNSNAINTDKQYILRISPKEMEFILLGNEKTVELSNLKNIKQFILNNFSNQVLGIKYSNKMYFDYFDKLDDIKLIDVK